MDGDRRYELGRAYRDESLRLSPIPTGIIQDLLARIEKYSESDELNCSACGYNTCREKAQATYWGMAEISMCVPYMRRRAESLANLVMDVVPSAVVVLDYQLRVQRRRRRRRSSRLPDGSRPSARYLDEFIPTSTFKEVQSWFRQVLGRRQRYRDDLIVKEFVVPVPRSNLHRRHRRGHHPQELQQAELTHIREATIERAQEVIAKQFRVAHEIASLLGETTAETKVQLTRMIDVIRGPDGRQRAVQGGVRCRRDRQSLVVEVGHTSLNKQGEGICGDCVKITDQGLDAPRRLRRARLRREGEHPRHPLHRDRDLDDPARRPDRGDGRDDRGDAADLPRPPDRLRDVHDPAHNQRARGLPGRVRQPTVFLLHDGRLIDLPRTDREIAGRTVPRVRLRGPRGRLPRLRERRRRSTRASAARCRSAGPGTGVGRYLGQCTASGPIGPHAGRPDRGAVPVALRRPPGDDVTVVATRVTAESRRSRS